MSFRLNNLQAELLSTLRVHGLYLRELLARPGSDKSTRLSNEVTRLARGRTPPSMQGIGRNRGHARVRVSNSSVISALACRAASILANVSSSLWFLALETARRVDCRSCLQRRDSGLLISWNEDEPGFEPNRRNIIGHGWTRIHTDKIRQAFLSA